MSERTSSQRRECYHLDTNYLINYLTHIYDTSDLSRRASQVVNQALAKGIPLKISALVGGEFLNVASKYTSPLLYDLAGFIEQGKFAICIIEQAHLDQFGTLIPKIRQSDNRIESMDVLLVAHSMIDVECKGFLTFDAKIINSLGLKSIIDESPTHRNRFQITDEPF